MVRRLIFVVATLAALMFCACKQVTTEHYEVKLECIALKSLPKLAYKTGEAVDWTGLAVDGIYTDGSVIALSPEEWTISVENGKVLEEGNYSVSVAAAKMTAVFPVYVASPAKTPDYPEYKDFPVVPPSSGSGEGEGGGEGEEKNSFFPLFNEMPAAAIRGWFVVNLNEAFANGEVQTALAKQDIATVEKFAEFLASVNDEFIEAFARQIQNGGTDSRPTDGKEEIPVPTERNVAVPGEDIWFSDNGDGTATVTNIVSRRAGTYLEDWTYIPGAPVTDVEIPSKWNGLAVTKIACTSYYDSKNDSMMTLVVPDTVTEIGSEAFKNCRNLVSVTLPNTITSMGYRAFFGCEKLAYFKIPAGVTVLEISLLAGTAITSIEIPETVTTIEYGAFADTPLTEVTIPASIKKAYQPFGGCKELTKIVWKAGEDAWVDDFFEGIESEFEFEMEENSAFPQGKCYWGYSTSKRTLKSVTLPTTLTEIPREMFKDIYSLESVNLSEISPPEYDEYGNLTNPLIIRESAFEGCSGLKSVGEKFPERMTVIERSAFKNCTSLFMENPGIAWASISNSPISSSVGDYAFQNCKSLAGTLLLAGNYYYGIGTEAFSCCTGLTEIVIGYERTGDPAFLNCPVTIREYKQENNLGNSLFINCSNVTKVTMNWHGTIENQMFYNCSSLKTIEIPSYWEDGGKPGGIQRQARYVSKFSGITTFMNCPLEQIIVHSKDEYDWYVASAANVLYRDKFVLAED